MEVFKSLSWLRLLLLVQPPHKIYAEHQQWRKIDFSRSAQTIWKKVYDQNVDANGTSKTEDDETKKKNK